MTPSEIKAAAKKRAQDEADAQKLVNDQKRAECREQGKREAEKHWEKLRAEIDAAAEKMQSQCTFCLTDGRSVGGREYLQAVRESFDQRCAAISVRVSGGIEYNAQTEYVGSCNPEPVGSRFVDYTLYLKLEWD